MPFSKVFVMPQGMDSASVCLCLKDKAPLQCGVCQQALCKKCACFTTEDSFALDLKISPEFKHGAYCPDCFHQTVSPAEIEYEERLALARAVSVYLKGQGKETRLMKRKHPPLLVEDCQDREEALMKLAFAAVQLGYRILIDVDLVSTKVRHGGYQTLIWRGSAVPFKD